MKKINENTILVALIILALVPIMLLRDFTPDNELRYLSIADEAIRDGHIFAFYNQYVPYADKPPLYLWIVMLGKLLFGRHVMLFLSIFSLVPALIVMGVMDKWTAAYTRLSLETRRTGKLMLMTTGLFLGMALTIRMDMLMCMFIVLALRTFYRMYAGKGRPADRWLFPIYIFLGIFTKGPIAILVPLISIPVFLISERKARTVFKYWGWRTWATLLVLCAVWFGCVYIEGGSTYLDNLLFNQTVNRAVDSFHHKAPFWYYLIAFWYSVAPWCLLIFLALVSKLRRDSHSDSIERFYITVALSTLVMLSLISSKIAVYFLPAFPFFVYIAVVYIERCRFNNLAKLSLAIPAVIFAISPIVLISINLFGMVEESSYYYGIAIALCVCGSSALWQIYKKENIRNAVRRMSIGVLLTVFLAGLAVPKMNSNIGFRNVCTEAKRMAEENDTQEYVTYGIRRPESMDVFLGIDVQKVEAEDIKLERHNNAILIAKKRRIDKDEVLAASLAGRPQSVVGDYIIIVL